MECFCLNTFLSLQNRKDQEQKNALDTWCNSIFSLHSVMQYIKWDKERNIISSGKIRCHKIKE